jgi:hypothetical protein
MRLKLTGLCCVLFVLSGAISSFAQMTVSDDSFVSSATPTANNGTSPSLVVQAPGGYSYVRFDLTKTLPGTVNSSMVSKATLRLYSTAVTAGGNLDVYEVAGGWCEKTAGTCTGITYNNRPASGVQVFAGLTIPAGSAGQYVSVDVTQAVKDWIDFQNGSGGRQNFGLVLVPSSGSSVSVTFESKESTTTGHDPRLTVVLNGPQGVAGPTGPTGPTGPQGPPEPQPFAGQGLKSDGLSPETLSVDPVVVASQADLASEKNRAQTAENTLNASIGVEAATRANAIAAETARAQGAEGTLTTNLSSEIARATRAENTKADLNKPVQVVNSAPSGSCSTLNYLEFFSGGDPGSQLYVCRDDGSHSSGNWTLVNDTTSLSQSLQNTGKAYTDTQVAAEAATRGAADIVGASNLGTEVSRAQGAEGTLSSSISSEVSRATAAENTKADINKPVQIVNSAPTGSCSTVNYLEFFAGGDPGEQLYVCRDDGSHSSGNWTLVNDTTSLSQNLQNTGKAYTDAQVANEAGLRSAADAAAAASLTSEVSRAQGAEAALNTSLGNKADLTNTNIFTGDNSFTKTLQANGGLGVAGNDGSNQLHSFRFATDSNGKLSLETAVGGGSLQAAGFSIGSDGKVDFATGQTFPGTQAALTAGTGISIASNTISNSGVTSLTGSANQILASGSTGAVTLSLPSTITANVSGTAASITGSITESQVSGLAIDLTGLNTSLATKVSTSAVGSANGVASLDGNGFVPTSQLANLSSLYVDLSTAQSVGGNKTFTGLLTLAKATINQGMTGADAISGARASDSTITGNLLRFTNAANTTDLWTVDAAGTLQVGSIPAARISGNITATTANALAATPAQCAAGSFATGIAASGTANCTNNGSGLTNVSAASLSGLGAATTATANTIAARDGSGNLTANQLIGGGASITGLDAGNLSAGTIPSARLAVTRVSNSASSAAGANAGSTVNVTVSCPAGKVLIGGGGQASNNDSGQKTALVESYPTSTTQWSATGAVMANLSNGKTLTVTAYALCGGA